MFKQNVLTLKIKRPKYKTKLSSLPYWIWWKVILLAYKKVQTRRKTERQRERKREREGGRKWERKSEKEYSKLLKNLLNRNWIDSWKTYIAVIYTFWFRSSIRKRKVCAISWDQIVKLMNVFAVGCSVLFCSSIPKTWTKHFCTRFGWLHLKLLHLCDVCVCVCAWVCLFLYL